MLNRKTPSRRLIFITLGLTYIAVGILGTLPGASLLRLAHNTHVSLETVGSMFTISALGFMLGAVLAGTLTRYVKSRYWMILGLVLLVGGALITAFTDSFALLLLGQTAKGFGFGFIDIGLNNIATASFTDNLSENLNNIHGMYGLGALLGPLILAFGLQFFASMPMAYIVGSVVALIPIVLALIQNLPEASIVSPLPTNQRGAGVDPEHSVMRQRLLWLIVLSISLYAGAEIGFGNWIVTTVSQSAGISLALAAPVATAFFLGLTAGRLGGAQVLRMGWLSERRLLYTALIGGAASGVLAALFPGQLLIVYIASCLVGCFYGPLFPSLMAIASRHFVYALSLVNSVMMVGTGASAMLIPAGMGLLIPVVGISWVTIIPPIACLLVILPMTLANRVQPGLFRERGYLSPVVLSRAQENLEIV